MLKGLNYRLTKEIRFLRSTGAVLDILRHRLGSCRDLDCQSCPRRSGTVCQRRPSRRVCRPQTACRIGRARFRMFRLHRG